MACGNVCAFCKQEVDSIIVGEKLSSGNLLVHQYCLYFSSGLAQNGDENDQVNTISGFQLQDILKELHRESHMRCCGCNQPGGFVGCMVKSCRKAGHFPCLHKLGYTFHYGGNFEAYCPKHCPAQPKLKHSDSLGNCCICLSSISSSRNLYCPCCVTKFHKACIEKQALSAGLYYMRCPVCKDKDTYCSEMLRMGINIPDRDAEWEVGTVYETEVAKYCHAGHCLCPEGRSHYTHIGKYRIRKCSTCGQYRGHVECLRRDKATECEDCRTVRGPLHTELDVRSVQNTLSSRCIESESEDITKSPVTSPPNKDMKTCNTSLSNNSQHLVRAKVPVLVLKKLNITFHHKNS